MTGNEVLRRVRFALGLRNRDVQDLLAFGGAKLSDPEVRGRLCKDGDDEWQPCSTEELTAFLDGLILRERGEREDSPAKKILADSNNVVLRKLRIALQLRDSDMRELIELGGIRISKPELSALFRAPGHPHYRECGDQVLRYFLQGLTRQRRPELGAALEE